LESWLLLLALFSGTERVCTWQSLRLELVTAHHWLVSHHLLLWILVGIVLVCVELAKHVHLALTYLRLT